MLIYIHSRADLGKPHLAVRSVERRLGDGDKVFGFYPKIKVFSQLSKFVVSFHGRKERGFVGDLEFIRQFFQHIRLIGRDAVFQNTFSVGSSGI